MKIKVFDLDTQSMRTDILSQEQTFEISMLPAYAVDYAVLYVNAVANPIDDVEVLIRNNQLVWKLGAPNGYDIDRSDICRLEIRYYGIRDYKLLFPKVLTVDPDRAQRLGQFYQELETSFDNAAWLSSMLMAGAIFEHLLYFKLSGSKRTLDALNKAAWQSNIISRSEHDVIETTRVYRNVIHWNRMNDRYVDRKDALDARSLIEKLLLRLQ